MNHSELVKRFVKDGATKGKASNMFIEGDVLYSYGHHFPLLVRMPWGYLQNADRYSPTTGRHQGECRRYATVLIPFSSLRGAGMNFYSPVGYSPDVELIDREEARTDERVVKDKDGNDKTIYERRPEGCILKHGEKFFLSSMDHFNYFLTELPGPVKTVAEAFTVLRPELAQGEEGTDYLRQGEWFFIPLKNTLSTLFKVKVSGKGAGVQAVELRNWQKEANERNPGAYPLTRKAIIRTLPSRNMAPHHYATEYGEIKGIEYPIVRGTVRHSAGDHRMLKLGNGREWYIAVESNQVQSWGASGKVD